MEKLSQEYNKYTEEDRKVWGTLFTRQMDNLKGKTLLNYYSCIEKIGFIESEIPNFDKVDKAFAKETGWSIEVVAGLIDVEPFFQLLSEKRFCSSTWLRTMDQLDYLEEPDMFHDSFGHLPFLMNPQYSAFTQNFGKLGLKYLNHPEAIVMLQRIYWFTLEFGLIKENGEVRAYGAGILSSFGETNYSLSIEPIQIEFDIVEVMNTPFKTDEIQPLYFVIESFEALYNSIEEIDKYLESKFLLVNQ